MGMPRGRGKTFKVGRNAITGRFKTVKQARRQKRTSEVETIKKRTK